VAVGSAAFVHRHGPVSVPDQLDDLSSAARFGLQHFYAPASPAAGRLVVDVVFFVRLVFCPAGRLDRQRQFFSHLHPGGGGPGIARA